MSIMILGLLMAPPTILLGRFFPATPGFSVNQWTFVSRHELTVGWVDPDSVIVRKAFGAIFNLVTKWALADQRKQVEKSE